jgi:hypothetical protein
MRMRSAVAVGMPLRLDFGWYNKSLAMPDAALSTYVMPAHAGIHAAVRTSCARRAAALRPTASLFGCAY